MNTQPDNTNTQQVTEAFPLEDHSLPAEEVLTEQQAEFVEIEYTPTFIP